ncbi:hypothetical protein [Erwinia pyrifoliae]|uniref:hypothetical protein n=1 Tax=Erwinia pyrifoliae TaxID=79967 RepID=UPI0021F9F586|nr:hypothetical protein [Erwinia pyrifoliae]UWS28911.1 hypothetical protein NYP81_13375 [Erwinia pyrifoliae]
MHLLNIIHFVAAFAERAACLFAPERRFSAWLYRFKYGAEALRMASQLERLRAELERAKAEFKRINAGCQFEDSWHNENFAKFIRTFSVSIIPAQSAIGFIAVISEAEGLLLSIRALNRLAVNAEAGPEEYSQGAWQVFRIAEVIGFSCEAKFISQDLFEKYVTDLILLGNEIDARAWNHGFNEGIKRVLDVEYRIVKMPQPFS